MSKINNKTAYPFDTNLSLDDFVIGSDADNLDTTRNYPLSGIFSTFKSSLDLASLSFCFAGGSDPDLDFNDAGYFTTNSNETSAAAVVTIKINKIDLDSIDMSALVDTIALQPSSFILRLFKPSAVGQVFFYSITTIVDNATYYTFTVDNFVGNGTLGDETTYSLAFDLAGVPSIYTETDPVFLASPVGSVTAPDVTNWTTAYGWGDHGAAGYQDALGGTGVVKSTAGTISYLTDNSTNWNTAFGWGNHASAGYLTSYTETDPVFVGHAAYGVTSVRLTQWDTAFGWGDHGAVGYITSYTETDPVFVASDVFGVTTADINQWVAAYQWGDHAAVGYDILDTVGVLTRNGFTDNADGTIAVSGFDIAIRNVDDDEATPILYFTIAPVASLALTDMSQNWIYVEYNGGAPQIIASLTERTDRNTNILLGKVYREALVLHPSTYLEEYIGNFESLSLQRYHETEPYRWASGSQVSEPTSLKIAITEGKFWEKLNKFTVPAFDSSASGTFEYYYDDGAAGWTEVAAQVSINNTQYDDGTGTLATLTNNHYGIHFLYGEPEGDFSVIYGTGNYNRLSDAQDASPPAVTPTHVLSHGALIAKIIVQKSATSFTDIQSAFETKFQSSGVSSHLDLADIGTNTHAQIDTHIGDTTIHYTQAAISIPLSQISDVSALAAEVNLLDLSGLTAGWVLSADTATTASWKAASGGTLSSLTDTTITGAAKGDLLVYNGSAWVDVTVGADTFVLTADSVEVSGVKWAAASGGGAIGGTITDNQIAVGATTADDIEGSANLTWDLTTLLVEGAVQAEAGYFSAKRAGGTADTHIANMGTSSTADNFLFGGSTTGSTTSMDVYLRVSALASNGLLFTENATNHTVWHSGIHYIGTDRGTSISAAATTVFTAVGATASSILTASNTTGSTGFPSATGQGLYVKGAAVSRDFAFWRTAAAGDNRFWYGNMDTAGTAWEFNQVFHEFSNSPTWDGGTTDNTWTISSTADVTLHLQADSDNVTETDNVKLLLSQDGGLKSVQIGLTGSANEWITGTASNDTYFMNFTATEDFHFGYTSAGTASLKIDNGRGGIKTGEVWSTGAIATVHSAKDGQAFAVQGGSYSATTTPITGAIVIKLPDTPTGTTGNAADMITFSVNVFDYAGGDGEGESFKIDIAGYPHVSGWGNTNATIYSTRVDKDWDVRFYYNGSSHFVTIGELASTWAYPQVHVYDLFVGYNAIMEDWITDWAVTFETSFAAFGTLDHTIVGNLVTAGKMDVNTSTGNIVVQASTDRVGLLEIGSTTNYSWHGIQIKDDGGKLWSVMGNATQFGLYDDSTSEFFLAYTQNTAVSLYYNGVVKFATASGGITVTGDGTATDWNLSSDERLKYDIEPLGNYEITTNWVKYKWKDTDREDIGVIAQDLEKTNPEFVKHDDEGMKSVSYTKLLVAKMAEKDTQIKSLQFRLEQLEAKMELLIKGCK